LARKEGQTRSGHWRRSACHISTGQFLAMNPIMDFDGFDEGEFRIHRLRFLALV
jgi:hypothetical protein